MTPDISLSSGAGQLNRSVYRMTREDNGRACNDQHIIAMYLQTLHDIHAELKPLAEAEPTPDHLTGVFIEELERAQQFSLLSAMQDPAMAPRLTERILASDALSRQRIDVWAPILSRYAQAGVLAAGIDVHATVQWLTHQHLWILLYPRVLADDAATRRGYIRDFVVRPLLAS